MVTGPKGPAGPAGPGGTPETARIENPRPTQAPVTAALPGGQPVSGVIRTRKANIIERVGWTAVQAFVATFTTVFFGAQQFDMSNLKTAALAGASAVGAALLSLVKNVVTTRLEG